MTYQLTTCSHGVIQSGFFGTFTQMVRLGVYVFLTKNFCEQVQEIAEDSDLRIGKLLSFSKQIYLERRAEQRNTLLETLVRQGSKAADELIIDQQMGPSIDDELDLRGEGTMVPLRITSSARDIVVGQYRVTASRFASFSTYIASGGFFGWCDGVVPRWAQRSLDSLSISYHPLFGSLKKHGSECLS